MRVSSYVIGAPLPGQPFHILMHGFSGSVDKVGSDLGQTLVDQRGQEFECQDWPDETVSRLADRGYLTTLTNEEERDVLLRLASELHELDLAKRASMFVVVPTYLCNLRCPYCFQTHDMHAGKDRFSSIMTDAQVDQMFTVIDRYRAPGSVAAALGVISAQSPAHQPAAAQPDITLFGGEPLLEVSLGVVTRIVERAVERKLALGAITNGVELDRFAHLLGPGLIDDLQITIDGPPATHDSRRIGPGYSHTFSIIADNVQLALDRGSRVGIRINVDEGNARSFPELEDYFTRRGWTGHPNFFAKAAEVHAGWAPPANQKLVSGSQLVQITMRSPSNRPQGRIESYEGTARKMLVRCLSGEGYPFRTTTYCGAEAGMMIFDPLGDVYACWEQIGHSEMRIAQYGEGGLRFDAETATQWLRRYPGTIDDCSRCPYALIHTSGCAHEAWRESGTIFASACQSFQDYFPETLATAYLEVERAALLGGSLHDSSHMSADSRCG